MRHLLLLSLSGFALLSTPTLANAEGTQTSRVTLKSPYSFGGRLLLKRMQRLNTRTRAPQAEQVMSNAIIGVERLMADAQPKWPTKLEWRQGPGYESIKATRRDGVLSSHRVVLRPERSAVRTVDGKSKTLDLRARVDASKLIALAQKNPLLAGVPKSTLKEARYMRFTITEGSRGLSFYTDGGQELRFDGDASAHGANLSALAFTRIAKAAEVTSRHKVAKGSWLDTGSFLGRLHTKQEISALVNTIEATRSSAAASVLTGKGVAGGELVRIQKVLDNATSANPVRVTHRKSAKGEVLKVRSDVEGKHVALAVFPHGSAMVSRENSGTLNVMELRAKVAPGSLATFLKAKGLFKDPSMLKLLESAKYLRFEGYGEGKGSFSFYSSPNERLYHESRQVKMSGTPRDFVRMVKGAREISNDLDVITGE
ncbi:MAG: hypothetical protein JRH20_16795 [Deltaproteobacteria bacterium]|nr:hypothetical protein [Deltaproteobacteria bacterium]